jgi:mono/diheme cytochrome c family protein
MATSERSTQRLARNYGRKNLGSGIGAGPITYSVNGKQYVAVVIGRTVSLPAFLGDIGKRMIAATPEMIAAGKEIFNSICAHCHGPDSVQGVKKIDLRRLTLRYSDGAHNMYWKAVHEGRPAKGMPTWKRAFTDEQFEQIYAFLSSIQSTE